MHESITRRRFLVRSAQLALMASAGAACARGPRAEMPATGVSPRAWQELARRLSGPLIRPEDPSYARIATPNNLAFNSVLPGGIARCVDAKDVAQTILWAREFGVPRTARCGGHSYAGYSTTGGVMIDLSPINQVQFDAGTGIATIGGGVRNSTLYPALQKLGVAITHGRCPSVGVGGFFLGGGIGFNMRARGLACDQMVRSQLVTADGQVLSLDPKSPATSDLFWACRGGAGGNFGINTAFTVQTFGVSRITAFSLSWAARPEAPRPQAFLPEAVYTALLAALDKAPAGLGSRVQITPVTPEDRAVGRDASVQLLGQFTGTPGDVRDILRPVYAVATPASEKIEEMDYWKAQISFLSEAGYPGFYQERSRFFTGLSAPAIATAFHWARRWPGTPEGAHMVLFQTGEKVNALPPDATAFVHRNSTWLMTIALSWGGDTSDDVLKRNRDWQNAFYESMRPFATPGSYQNFPDPSLTNFLDSYYGANLPKLRRIKREVDPTRVFDYPQAIPPA